MSKGMYEKTLICWNCLRLNNFKVPKGIEIKDWGDDCPKCKYCGCDPRLKNAN